MSIQRATRSSNQPLGTSGSLRRRSLLHHLPIALACAVVLVLFMSLPLFDARVYPHADIFSGTLPHQRAADHNGPMSHGADRSEAMGHGEDHTGGMGHGGDHTGPGPDQTRHRSFIRQLTLATGYVALGLLTLTLLIGPANLLLRKRNPVSNYLRRDAGAWTASFSVVHVIFGLQVHGGGQVRDFLRYFVAPDGSPWLNAFGLGNWTGLAALVIVMGLLALSNDFALRKLKATTWKALQRLNYVLFALVILHAIFYGALLRITSPFTLLLGCTVVGVFVGQAVGMWLWRRRHFRTAAGSA